MLYKLHFILHVDVDRYLFIYIYATLKVFFSEQLSTIENANVGPHQILHMNRKQQGHEFI